MKFFRTIRASLHDPSFYREAKDARASQALKYFALLVLIASVVTTVWLGVSFFSWASRTGDIRELRDTALSIYPDELVLDYRDGRVTSNVEEPYFIPTPKEFRNTAAEPGSERTPANLVVISTKSPVTPADFGRYDTSVILAGDSLWINDTRKGKIEIQPFDSRIRTPFTLNKGVLASYADKLISILKPIVIGMFLLLPFILFPVFMAGYLFYLVFGALVVWVIGKIRSVDLTYGQSYKLGLYLMTAPLIYGFLSDFIPHTKIPFLFTAILAIAASVNLVPPKPEQPSTNEPETPKGTEIKPESSVWEDAADELVSDAKPIEEKEQ